MTCSQVELEKVVLADSYQEFKERLRASQCNRCPSLCHGRHTIVVDRGDHRSKIMVIGEAPGETEDLTGQAFVGRAGKLLDQMFATVGINTNSDVLIANIVKCRPPGNRRPTPKEASQCRPYLLRQLELIRPLVVVLLGATAAKHMIPNDDRPMRNRVGGIFQNPLYSGVDFQILYHPAFLLRDPRKKPETLDHMRQLKFHLDAKLFLTPKD